MAMTGLATPGNENRADETNPILGFQSRNRKHEESMTYTIFPEEANSGRQAGRPTLLALGCAWDDMLWLSYSQLSMRARGSRVGKWWMLLREWEMGVLKRPSPGYARLTNRFPRIRNRRGRSAHCVMPTSGVTAISNCRGSRGARTTNAPRSEEHT